MNKTININLAGLFFHIDEDAYQRLQRYLAAVRRSFTGTTGADEIMNDIESRIAELFLEKRANEQQVISINHVEEVIAIMGQPEDYEVDEDIFTEQTSSRQRPYRNRGKQLFRDTQDGYVGGVSAGLAHFLGIDAIWVRLLWAIFTILSSGFIVLLYVIFWILVPDAVTTNQRLTMMGKEVNITNIEENFKAGFEPVAGEQTDAGHRVVGQRGKRSTVRFFSFLGRLIKGIFIALVKIIGLFVFLGATIGLVALIISTITAGAVDIDGYSLINIFDLVVPAEYATWWLVISIILAAGIPLFFLAYLGLKMLVSNLKSIGTTAYISLSVLWIIAVIALSIMIGKIAASTAVDATSQQTEKFSMRTDRPFEFILEEDTSPRSRFYSNTGFQFEMDGDDQERLRIYKVNVAVGATTDSVATVDLKYTSSGSSFENALNKARNIQFDYTLTDSTFVAPDYFTVPKGAGLVDHKVTMMVYLPEGTVARFNERFGERYRSGVNKDAFSLGNNIENTYEIKDGKAICLDCPVIEEKEASDNNLESTDSIGNESTTQDVDNNWEYDGEDGVEQNDQP
jgi:phage shock protein PspC (stress-responsive transcriptional regulator)